MNNSEIFIVGANGQLGTALRALYPAARSADISELDITDRESVEAFDWSGINVIMNAAAYTAVDNAETDGRAAAWAVNAVAVANLARVARAHDITLVHISTDYVFDGTRDNHTETEAFEPLGVYGQTKAAGDIAASMTEKYYILRTSWVIGKGNNFVRTMKNLAEKGVKPSVVDDQIGRLTFTDDLAAAMKHLVDTKASYGTYNLSNDGEPASWATIAKRVYELAGHDASEVTPVTTAEYYTGKTGIAPRPLHSTLDLTKIKATGFTPRDWHAALDVYWKELTSEE
ncbi:MAG TPA: dTDP-4-dehydrorhamnose reductase [Candidatus Saccharimonadaceae bacterium]|nr:dTDP-4-dehydrorhamnose reductase [Candidatus Saccharimonadaceae bacterium]